MATSTNVFEATTDTFDTQILGQGVALVDFWASWCPPCRAMSPVVDELGAQFEGRATIAKVDVDANAELAARYSVASIPTFILFKDGEEVSRSMGVQPAEELAAAIESVL